MSATHIVSIGFAIDARGCDPADIAAQIAMFAGREMAPFLVGNVVTEITPIEVRE